MNTNDYLNTFTQVMPQRIEKIRDVFVLKGNLDLEILNILTDKNTIIDLKFIEILVDLQKCIGEDKLFRKPEKETGSQTLRHYVWKSQKSLLFLGDNMGNILTEADKESFREIELSNVSIGLTADKITIVSSKAAKLTGMLDLLLEKESTCLQTILFKISKSRNHEANIVKVKTFEKDFDTYVKLVSEERVYQKALSELFSVFTKTMVDFQQAVIPFIEEIKRKMKDMNFKHRSNDIPKIIQDITVLGVAVGVIVSFYITAKGLHTGNPSEFIHSREVGTSIVVISSVVAIITRAILPLIPSPESKRMAQVMDCLSWMDEK